MTVSKSPSLFVSEFFRSFHTTGAVLPSGRALARALAAPLDERSGPRKILEAGPGTGAVTEVLIRKLESGDELTLCEINPAFADRLEERLRTDPVWREKREAVRVLRADVREIARAGAFDLIVSGLPLNNFSPELVGELLDGFLEGLAPGGIHTFFEYRAIRRIRMRVGSSQGRRRMRAIEEAVMERLRSTEWERVSVMANIPPAWVYKARVR
jgi:phospholipid N-methyltransferase